MRDLRPGAGRGRGSLTAAMGYFGSAQVEEDAGFDVALLDLGEALVDLGELSGLPDHPGPALPMYRVRRGKVLAGADDRTDDGDAVYPRQASGALIAPLG
jgi:hypothetical protein